MAPGATQEAAPGILGAEVADRYRPVARAAWRRRVLVRELRGLLALVVAWGILARWGAGYALAFLGGFIAVVLATLAARRQRERRGPRLSQALLLLDHGLTDEAISLLETEIDRMKSAPPAHSAALMHLAGAFARKGRVEEARTILYAVHHESWLYSAVDHYVLAASIAATHASLGELEDATRWQKVAHGRLPAARRHDLAVLDAVLAARREQFADLAASLSTEWAELEVDLADKSYSLKVLRLLRAFALDRSRSAGEGEAGTAPGLGALVDAARAAKGELVQHRAHWPAFDTFLASHGVE